MKKIILVLIAFTLSSLAADRAITVEQATAARAQIAHLPRRVAIVIWHVGGEARRFRNRVEAAFRGQGPGVSIMTDPLPELPDGVTIAADPSDAARANRIRLAFQEVGIVATVTTEFPVAGKPQAGEIWIGIGDNPN